MLRSEQRQLAGHLVAYAGRTYVNGKTRFTYTVTGTGAQSSLSHFTIGLPSCAPALFAHEPASASATIGLDPPTGIYGLTWGNLSLGAGESLTYSITFLGDVAEGLVRLAVKSGSDVGVGAFPGPCGGFVVSGNVYVDADSSGDRDARIESGAIAGVTVALVDAGGEVETTRTDETGHYSFLAVDGAYTVRIDPVTPSDDFNEDLAQSFFATGPVARNVTLGPDAPGVDFGYKPQAKKIIYEFSAGALVSTGETDAFWTKVLRAASRGQTYSGYNAASVTAILRQIEGSFLQEPYQFTDGREISEALAILTGKPRDAVGILYKQLFVAELNDASGRGIVANPDLQDALLAWGESLLAGASASMRASGDAVLAAATSGGSLNDAITIFILLNNSRGGGEIPE